MRRLLLLLGGCLLLGLLTGEYAWALVLGLTGYLIWTLRQLLRLQRWLRRRIRPASGAISSIASTSCSAATCACAANCKASSIAPRALPPHSRMR